MRLVANASVLQAYFLQTGYDPASIVIDAAVPEGVVMFRGLDPEGRMALLLLRGALNVSAPGEESQAQFVSDGLLLAYLANPSNPDVFAVQQNQL